jgi:DNA-binding NarL/FixJ family response regulator
MSTRVLIADDHRMFREALVAVLPRSEFEVVAEAANGRDAISQASRHQPDVALIDITMPGLNGVDTTREVLRASPATRVLMLTMHNDRAYLVEALAAGARGFVVKSQGTPELVEALRTVANGRAHVPPGLLDSLVDTVQSPATAAADPLTPREREVLQLVAEGKCTKEIAASLGISYKTAESHRGHIMAKLDIHETAGLVRYAIRRRMIQA